MSVNILSQDGKTLVNYDNVASLYIQKKYVQYSHPDTWWEIRAMYPSLSPEDALYDIIARFDDENECELAFRKIVNLICEQKEVFILIDNI